MTVVDPSTDSTVAEIAIDGDVAPAAHGPVGHPNGEAAGVCPPHLARQLVIDLGLPRNVDPSVASVHGVELLDLETIRIHAPLEELQATDVARRIVSRAAEKYTTVSEEITLTPAVVALRQHVFGILDAEIDRARSRGDEDGRTEQALRHLAGVLLHTPMVRARDAAHAGDHERYVDALDALFGIDVSLSADDASAAWATDEGAGGDARLA